MTDTKKRHVGLQEIVARLQEEFGPVLEADYRSGRRQIARFLRIQFELKRKEANELIEILEDNRSLCYIPPIELTEEFFRDPRRAAELVTAPSLRDLARLSSARRSDKAHWLIGNE